MNYEVEKKDINEFIVKYVCKIFDEDNIENVFKLSLDELKNKINSLSKENILNLFFLFRDHYVEGNLELDKFSGKIAFTFLSIDFVELFGNMSRQNFIDMVKNFCIEENFLEYYDFDDDTRYLSDSDKGQMVGIFSAYDSSRDFFSNCSEDTISELSDELLILYLSEREVSDEFITMALSDRNIDINSVNGYALVNLLNYYSLRNPGLCKDISSKIFDDKNLFDSIKDKNIYNLIFKNLDKSKDVFEYMISNEDLIRYTSEFYTPNEVKAIIEPGIVNNPKYVKWFYEFFDIAPEELFEYLISDNEDINYTYVCFKLSTNPSNQLFSIFDNFSDEEKLNKIVKVYKTIAKDPELINDDCVHLAYEKLTEMVKNNKNIILKASDEDIKYFIANSFFWLKPNEDMTEILEFLRNKGLEFYKDIQKYKILDRSSRDFFSFFQLVFDEKMIEMIDDEEYILSILSISPETLAGKYEYLITTDIINKVSKFPSFNYLTLSSKTFYNILKNRIDDLPRNEKFVFAVEDAIKKPVTEENKLLLLKLKDVSDDDIRRLVLYYDFLGNDDEFAIRAIKSDPRYLFHVDKRFRTLDIARTLNFKSFTISSQMSEEELEFLYELINSGVLKLDDSLFNNLNYLYKDFYTKINPSILSDFLSNDLSHTASKYGYNKTSPIMNYISDELYGYISVFGFNGISTFIPSTYKIFFNRNGATDEIKNFLANNPVVAHDLINNSLMHVDEILDNPTSKLFEMFTPFILKEYSIDEKKLDYCLNLFEYKLLFNLGNENIVKFLKSPIDDCEKIFELIKVRSTTANKFSDVILDTLLQAEFTLKNKYEVDVFPNMCNLIAQISVENLRAWYRTEYDDEYTSMIDKNLSKMCTILNINLGTLKKAVLCAIDDLNPLSEICDAYVTKLRENYRANNTDFASRIGFEFKYDNESLIRVLIPLILQDGYKESFCILGHPEKSIYIPSFRYDELLKIIPDLTLEEFDIIYDIIYRNNGQKVKEIDKKKLSVARKYLKSLASEIAAQITSLHKSTYLKDVKKIYNIELSSIDYLDIICNLDIEVYLEQVYSDKEVYNHLMNTFNKFYLGQIPKQIEVFCRAELGLSLLGGINNIGTFILKYHNILQNKKSNCKKNTGYEPKIDEIKFNFSEIVNLINDNNSLKKELALLMGNDEYTDFVNEAKPNKNRRNRNQADQKLVPLFNFLYSVECITVPSKDEVIKSKKSNKKINIIVGNRTNTANLCHGERTGACMRLNGVGEGLFLMCLTNENWFHIRFEDPETHEYISRVSGFRNGNTLYLNQLRESGDKLKYSNEDLQEFIKIYADSVIEETKDSEYPIKNVFINVDYAMKSYNDKVHNLGEDKVSKYYTLGSYSQYGMRDSSFIWTDVTKKAYLLSTTDTGKKSELGFAEIKSGPDKAIKYKQTRDKIYCLDNNDINTSIRNIVCDKKYLIEKINQVNAFMELFSGKNYKYDISKIIENDTAIKDGFVGPDWYVYIDNDNNIIYRYMEYEIKDEQITVYHDSQRALEELNEYKEILERRYNNNMHY